jgi:hypothetical protein
MEGRSATECPGHLPRVYRDLGLTYSHVPRTAFLLTSTNMRLLPLVTRSAAWYRGLIA